MKATSVKSTLEGISTGSNFDNVILCFIIHNYHDHNIIIMIIKFLMFRFKRLSLLDSLRSRIVNYRSFLGPLFENASLFESAP